MGSGSRTVTSDRERNTLSTIQEWFRLVQKEEKLQTVLMSHDQLGSKELISVAAAEHGVERRRVGYTAAMLVEESRMLQVSIFPTLQNNLASIDFSLLLIGVMTIADEIDSQLSQAMAAYIEESTADALPA
jgi:hypothetical protein